MNDYYKIDSREIEGDETIFSLRLIPDYCVYKGHFPGNPISPGVCNIQMIKECTELLIGKTLFLAFIDKCKFLSVMSPQTNPLLKLRIHLTIATKTTHVKPPKLHEQLSKASDIYNVHATLFDDTTTYIILKGQLKTENYD